MGSSEIPDVIVQQQPNVSNKSMNNKQVAAHIDEVWCSQLIVLYTDDHRYVKLCAFNWKEAGGPHSSSAHTAARGRLVKEI